jgi:hypothetical protein
VSTTDYVELHCHSNFSFLNGGSHPAELAVRAAGLGMKALALTDTGRIYGIVRFREACRKAGVKPIYGACLEVDGHELTFLCRLLSLAHQGQRKGEARTTLARPGDRGRHAEHRQRAIGAGQRDHPRSRARPRAAPLALTTTADTPPGRARALSRSALLGGGTEGAVRPGRGVAHRAQGGALASLRPEGVHRARPQAASGTPGANAIGERVVRTLRREWLDHIVPLSERHVRAALAEYASYFNHDRPHRSLELETGPSQRPVAGEVVVRRGLGGFHHVYERAA